MSKLTIMTLTDDFAEVASIFSAVDAENVRGSTVQCTIIRCIISSNHTSARVEERMVIDSSFVSTVHLCSPHYVSAVKCMLTYGDGNTDFTSAGKVTNEENINLPQTDLIEQNVVNGSVASEA